MAKPAASKVTNNNQPLHNEFANTEHSSTSKSAAKSKALANGNLPLGTWENKDEDDDGIPDELDDYPFDANRNKYKTFIEVEPNDNPSIATPITVDVGVKVQGVIDSEFDKGDLFKFVVDKRQSMTAYFKSSSPRFQPQVYVSNEDGLVINAIFLYKYSEPNVYVVNFPIYDPGTYQLSVIDENFAGGSDLSYEMVFFSDEDVDSFDDMQERALGSDLIENDMDNDDILDGLEYIFATENGSIDLDNDTLPNWLDEDSDGDNFSDKLEGSKNLDNDSLLNFLDLDADGNGIKDDIESGSPAQPNDFDKDGIIDHLDLDDDNDNIFDINDKERLKPANTLFSSQLGELNISQLSTVYDDSKIQFFLRSGDRFELTLEGFPAQAETPLLIIALQGKVYNVFPKSTVRDDDKSYLQFDMPIVTGQGEVTMVIGHSKSEPYFIEVGAAGLPLLKKSNPNAMAAGDEIRLLGDNFDKNTVVYINKEPITTQLINPQQVAITVPDNTNSGSYSVGNTYGRSNYINFAVQQRLKIDVTQLNPLSIDAIGSVYYAKMAKPVSGDTFQTNKLDDKAEPIFTYTLNQQGELVPYFSAIRYINDKVIEFNDNTTALTGLVLHLGWRYRQDGYDTAGIVELITATDAYEQFLREAELLVSENFAFYDFRNKSQNRDRLFDKYQTLIHDELLKTEKLTR
ncbi:hypothetical protein TUM4438_41780 [Shewanella sairae]|uniref:IPT/TIG domain-containing protein n=1 Tax=Shewanella sairae TaxID=190310 RepID=A0ABQ4PR93_9GAMM|nr:IPT/TIG domain-containing protein [Shewanella sairae]MCL1130384.1 hypothetical protein [Shewanella sairae]GIU51590.1 hypothetical protein TUM4438_41780 [Shewanella sairae]